MDCTPHQNIEVEVGPVECGRPPRRSLRELAAHSRVRRVPLCWLDREILEHHGFLPPELAHRG